MVCKLRYTDGEVAGWFGSNTAWWFGSNAASPAAGNNAFHNLPRNAIKTKKLRLLLITIRIIRRDLRILQSGSPLLRNLFDG